MSLDWLLQQALGPSSWVTGLASFLPGACDPRSITLPIFPDLKVTSLEAFPLENWTFVPDPALGGPQEPITGLEFCNITVSYTHPGWDDHIIVTSYLPTTKDKWNNRLLANGGGGFITGGTAISQMTMIPGLVEGFAVITTDGGHTSEIADALGGSLTWALSSPGNVNWPLLVDFASVALHDMATIGKQIVESYYGQPAAFSYFYGGSTGGRQGHMLAQRYPGDFDGILANMPAFNWTRFLWANIWAAFMMDKLGYYPRPCELDAMTRAAIAECDGHDGVEDGIISRPDLCNFNPFEIVGQEFDCDGVASTHASGAASIAKATWDGPRSSTGEFQWYGYPYDTNLTLPCIGPAATKCDDNGDACDATPFPISVAWAQYWIRKDPDFSTRNLSHEEWDELFHISVSQYGSIIGTDDPDLSGLRKANAKMINWHGMADAAIPVNGSVQYYDRVLARDPHAHDYYRFFLAPGAEHCLTCGMNPSVLGLLEVLQNWVEHGVAPETLLVRGSESIGGAGWERNICMYPRVQHYIGGDKSKVSSFTCT